MTLADTIRSSFRRRRKHNQSTPDPSSTTAKGRASASNSSIPRRTSRSSKPSPTEHRSAPLPRNETSKAERTPTRNVRDSFEMVKRRVSIPVSLLDRPLLHEVEFVMDARYHSLKLIGTGSFGVVASAKDTQTGQRVAIKKILSSFSSLRGARYILREVRLLRHLRHPNIVRLLDIDVPRQYRAWDEVYIVTPLLTSDLRTALNKGQVKSLNVCKRIAYDILCGLDHMHSLGLMHRDIKSRNIVVDDSMNAQLCDLGHSRFYHRANRRLDMELDASENHPELSGAVSTVIASAPEISLGAEYDATVDIWAAGCVIAEMLHPEHETLFERPRTRDHLNEIEAILGSPSKEDLEVFPEYSQWFAKLMNRSKPVEGIGLAGKLGPDADKTGIDLLEKMLQFSPAKRISAPQALAHEWFDDVRKTRVDDREEYDFASSEPHRKASRADIKKLVWEEVVAFHPEAQRMVAPGSSRKSFLTRKPLV